MKVRWIVPVAAVVALGSMGLPAQAAPLAASPGQTAEQSAVQQAHYYRRHHRYYRHYRRPGVYFYYGPRHPGIGATTGTTAIGKAAPAVHLAFTERDAPAGVDTRVRRNNQGSSTMKIVASLAAAAALAIAMPALAQTTAPKSATTMSQADCTAAWTKLDASKREACRKARLRAS